MADVITGWVLEDTDFSLMARVAGVDGDDIVQGDLASIAYAITGADGTSVGTGSLTVSEVVFDTLQTDARWSVDSTGYNFRWDVDVSAEGLVSPGTYTFEVAFTAATGEVYHAVWLVHVKGIAIS